MPEYRNALNNWGAQTGRSISYSQPVASGAQHGQSWSITVYVDNVEAGRGVGTTVAAAKEMAAYNALVACRVIQG
ncbi:hypothetical protein BDZ89DRAFT_1074824 [Hymenopellis radicata]|nr:hypothetical protein BDZ89DRAFT_1074824 [Hymenopellis radicata]